MHRKILCGIPVDNFFETAMEWEGKIAILMATYNGAPYLERQLESILSQSCTDWTLFVRDDGSTDETARILEDFQNRDPRIQIIDHESQNLGVVRNFEKVAETARSIVADFDLFFFSDQDDIWESDKLEKFKGRYFQWKRESSGDGCCLIHSDLRLIDATGGSLAPSFFRYQNLGRQEGAGLSVLLVQNFVTGCATAVNRKLLETGLPFPGSILMHDWWYAQIASACGEILVLDEPTVRYRQHGSNQVGAVGFWNTLNPLKNNLLSRYRRNSRIQKQSLEQAEQLLLRLQSIGEVSDQLSVAKNLVSQYLHANSKEVNLIQSLFLLRKWRIRRMDLLRTFLFYFRFFLMKIGV